MKSKSQCKKKKTKKKPSVAKMINENIYEYCEKEITKRVKNICFFDDICSRGVPNGGCLSLYE